MAKVLHSDPVHVHEEHRRDERARDQTAVVLVVLDPIQDAVPRVWHEELADYEGIKRPSEDEGRSEYKEEA